jgi:hypothetical protein
VDHFADCSDTYLNRYWVQEEWYKPGGPIIVYDNGEISGAYGVSLLRKGFFVRMLQEFGAMGIVWEHRYYGASRPEGNSTERNYLTVEQALADLPAMAAQFSRPRYPYVDLTPASTPWVFVGGSYPGVRAALSRLTYPNTFHAAWAASAPVEARTNFWSYWYPVIAGMHAQGKGGCLDDVQAAIRKIDAYLDNPETAKMIKQKFFPKPNATAGMTNEEFGVQFTFWYDFQGRGARGENWICNALETDPQTNATAPAEGWAPTKGVDWVIDRLQAVGGPWVRGRPKVTSFDDISWEWQYCSQFGYLMAYDPRLRHIISKYNKVDIHERYCREDFPAANLTTPQARSLNEKFGGWNMRPSNVFWSADEFDPWRTKSPLSDSPDAPKGITITQDIPRCGTQTDENTVFGMVMSNAEHCFEFLDSDQAKGVQAFWAKTLRTWLPCFTAKSQATVSPRIPRKCSASKRATFVGEPETAFSMLERVPISNDQL